MFKNLPKFNDQRYIHYITTKTFENHKYFKNEKCCLILLEELDFYRKKLGFKVLGYVIMPDHPHCLIWWDAEKYPELTISKIMQGIKGSAARRIIDYHKTVGRSEHLLRPGWEQMLPATHSATHSHCRGLKYQIWQPDFYDFNIYTEQKFREKLDYIHDNPRRAGLCQNPEDYRWSSCRQIMGLGPNPIFKIDFLEF